MPHNIIHIECIKGQQKGLMDTGYINKITVILVHQMLPAVIAI